ncbi:hypothetical protein CRI77_08615 [Mycolicibacterium duvalii]|uniref:Low molecular weight antigen MTB12-like C-terminal domain-containing protein n=1 Tax=Mycolicibacterium duvalii TaxID=39688 RepID=A0A7I7JWI3_9MYCO|nr:hypothetical protein [Mycolicibacterium duvalii]MCV7369465.1 hypothetical protein [Mycolicibacterium duvalii]PEG42108.1 hypothetical protein CRI77_08615 [Mycolicibacterium duvalii]BBX16185.1 hypothetical protein MDUV_10450 [Mycolicibacterium duvalii]
MTLKPLVTSLTAGVATAFVLGAVAGVTSIASAPGIAVASPAVVAPLPAAPAPDLQGPLVATLSGLQGPGTFTGAKSSYVQGGLGVVEARLADRGYRNAAAKGYFPLSFALSNIDQNGPVATALVTATAPTGEVASQPLTFIAGPSPTGWQLSKQSAMALMTSVG